MAKKKRSYGTKPAYVGNSGIAGDLSGLDDATAGVPPVKFKSSAATLDKRVRASVNTVKSTIASLLPNEVERGDWTVVILALMMFLTPAI